jgi:hypothetical protein
MFRRNSGFSVTMSEPDNSFGFASDGLSSKSVAHVEKDHSDFVKSLLAAPRSDEQQDLINRYFSLKAAVERFLADTRDARLADLTAQHDSAVADVRIAAAELEKAKLSEFAAYSKWESLAQEAKNRGAELQAAQGKLANTDKALLTRGERSAHEAHVAALRAKVGKATEIEGNAFTEYRSLVMAREAAEKAHHAAVSAATNLSREIDAL